MFSIGSMVIHKQNSEFGYGVVVQVFEKEDTKNEEDGIAVVLWHGDEKMELTEMPQIHKYSELKILNTVVGFA